MAKDLDFAESIKTWMEQESIALWEANQQFIRELWGNMPKPQGVEFFTNWYKWPMNIGIDQQRMTYIMKLFEPENWAQEDPAFLSFWDQLRVMVMSYHP